MENFKQRKSFKMFSSLSYTNIKVYQDGPMTPTVMDAILISFQLLSMHMKTVC